MALFEYRSEMPASAAELFAWHARPGAFERLVSPAAEVRVLSRDGGIEDGDRVVLAMKEGPFTLRWVAIHEGFEAGHQFSDRQAEGPFAAWRHTHRMVPLADDRSRLEDVISYRLPGGRLGSALGEGLIRARLGRTFAWRHARTRLDLKRHHAFAKQGPWRIAITGATGLVGSALAAFLSTGGHEVVKLVRRRPEPGSTDVCWDPTSDAWDPALLEGLDAVVHLAGENVGGGRWTRARMDAIMSSRREGTRHLTDALARLKSPPRVLVSASAVGYYGDGGDEPFDEDTRRAGSNFLAEVCQAWELATEPARQAGIRVVNLRFGTVLSPRGGALGKMLPPFRAGLGGVVGSGRQWMSWIALDDALGAIQHALFTQSLAGPVNATAPTAVTNAEFTRALGQVLHRPTILPLPKEVVLTLFGEMGLALLLQGQRVVPKRLIESGFEFACPWIETALRWELGEVPEDMEAIRTA